MLAGVKNAVITLCPWGSTESLDRSKSKRGGGATARDLPCAAHRCFCPRERASRRRSPRAPTASRSGSSSGRPHTRAAIGVASEVAAEWGQVGAVGKESGGGDTAGELRHGRAPIENRCRHRPRNAREGGGRPERSHRRGETREGGVVLVAAGRQSGRHHSRFVRRSAWGASGGVMKSSHPHLHPLLVR